MENKKPKKPGIRQINAMKTRMNIVESAMKLFEEHGYDNVTIRDITEKANVSLGSFYTYFESKDHIFMYINQYRISTYNEVYESLDKNKSAIERLIEFGEKVVDENYTLPVLRVLYSKQLIEGNMEKYSSSNKNTYDIFRKIIQEGADKGEIRNDLSVDAITYIVISCLRGILYNWCLNNGKSNLKEDLNNAIEILIDGIEKK